MITHHGKPLYTKVGQFFINYSISIAKMQYIFFQVCTEGRLYLEFTFDDLMRIKSWHFTVRTHRELIPRSVVSMHSQQDPSVLEQLSKNITRQGITNSTLNYLRVRLILQEVFVL